MLFLGYIRQIRYTQEQSDNNMHYSQIPEFKATNTSPFKIEPAQKTYFFQRPNGDFFFVGESTAWAMSKKFKYIGMSNGIKYQNAVKKSHELLKNGDLTGAKEALKLGELEELEEAKTNLVPIKNSDSIEPPWGIK